MMIASIVTKSRRLRPLLRHLYLKSLKCTATTPRSGSTAMSIMRMRGPGEMKLFQLIQLISTPTSYSLTVKRDKSTLLSAMKMSNKLSENNITAFSVIHQMSFYLNIKA